MSAPQVPAWVIAKLTTLLAEGKDRFIIAGLISASGFPCTPRQVKRWKEKHALRQQWRASDDDLDAVVQQLHDSDELGALEGYGCHMW